MSIIRGKSSGNGPWPAGEVVVSLAKPGRRGIDGSDYDADEEEFLKAAASYRSRAAKSFLTAVDYLRIARDLGYRKVAADPKPAEGT